MGDEKASLPLFCNRMKRKYWLFFSSIGGEEGRPLLTKVVVRVEKGTFVILKLCTK
jgi:hypothetical protein